MYPHKVPNLTSRRQPLAPSVTIMRLLKVLYFTKRPGKRDTCYVEVDSNPSETKVTIVCPYALSDIPLRIRLIRSKWGREGGFWGAENPVRTAAMRQVVGLIRLSEPSRKDFDRYGKKLKIKTNIVALSDSPNEVGSTDSALNQA
jgi:hypothetical protein